MSTGIVLTIVGVASIVAGAGVLGAWALDSGADPDLPGLASIPLSMGGGFLVAGVPMVVIGSQPPARSTRIGTVSWRF